MSPQRNTSPATSLRRHTIGGVPTSGLLALLLAGCAVDQATAPAAPQPTALVAAKSPSAPAPAPGSSKAKKKAADDAKKLTPAQLAAAQATWNTTPEQIETPTDQAVPLACGFRMKAVVSQKIGRNGGTLSFGKSRLVIPSGALSSDVQISATVTLGESIDVEFAPHGLQFAKPAELRVNYDGCSVPASPLGVYYVNDQDLITQTMPSTDNRGAKEIRSLTDHFSGYVVSWGRR